MLVDFETQQQMHFANPSCHSSPEWSIVISEHEIDKSDSVQVKGYPALTKGHPALAKHHPALAKHYPARRKNIYLVCDLQLDHALSLVDVLQKEADRVCLNQCFGIPFCLHDLSLLPRPLPN